MDFAALTAQQADALQGPHREAFYAWRRGDTAKITEIAEAYDLDLGQPAPVEGPPEVETPEKPGRPVETPERKPRRPPGRPPKTPRPPAPG